MKHIILFFTFFCIIPILNAQVLDLPSNHGGDLSLIGGMEVDAGVMLGDLDSLAARVTFPLSDAMAFVGDVAFADFEEVAVGGSLLYDLDYDLPFDIAAKGGFHTILTGDVDIFDIAVEALAGADIGSVDGLRWNANAGVHYVDLGVEIGFPGGFGAFEADDSDIAVGLGGGIAYEISDTLEAFANLDLLLGDFLYDDTILSAGVSWSGF